MWKGTEINYGTRGGMGWVWVWDTEVTEPIFIPLLNQTVSVTLSKLPQRTLVVQTLHVTLLCHFRNKTLPLVMRPTPGLLSYFLVPPPTGGQDSSDMGIQEWTCRCYGEVTGSRGQS